MRSQPFTKPMSANDNHFTILIVEDEEAIREMVRLTLEREHYQVLDCETVEAAQMLLQNHTVHLVLLDWMLPTVSGVEFAQQLRQSEQYSQLPIILLTAKNEEEDKLKGFKVGIDDYISKPFSLKEMLARVQSLLRRSHIPASHIANFPNNRISLSGLTIDKDSHLLFTEQGNEIHLGPTEFKLLLFLMSNPERVYSREQLLDQVWGVGVYVDERTVDVHIRRLRKALSPFDLANVIRTVRGSGYSFSKPR